MLKFTVRTLFLLKSLEYSKIQSPLRYIHLQQHHSVIFASLCSVSVSSYHFCFSVQSAFPSTFCAEKLLSIHLALPQPILKSWNTVISQQGIVSSMSHHVGTSEELIRDWKSSLQFCCLKVKSWLLQVINVIHYATIKISEYSHKILLKFCC